MPVYLQGFYQEFGFNNIYDPWSSYFLNMDNGNQLYGLVQRQTNELGINCEIYCYCYHHNKWDKVFVLYRSPSKSHLSSRFTLCDCRSGPLVHRKKIIAELNLKNELFRQKIGDRAQVWTLGSEKEEEIKNAIPDADTEKFFAELLFSLDSKKIRFEPIDVEKMKSVLKK